MIDFACRPMHGQAVAWPADFQQMLPEFRLVAERALDGIASQRREALMAQATAWAAAVFVRLAQEGRTDIVYPTPLALAAVKQVCTAPPRLPAGSHGGPPGVMPCRSHRRPA